VELLDRLVYSDGTDCGSPDKRRLAYVSFVCPPEGPDADPLAAGPGGAGSGGAADADVTRDMTLGSVTETSVCVYDIPILAPSLCALSRRQARAQGAEAYGDRYWRLLAEEKILPRTAQTGSGAEASRSAEPAVVLPSTAAEVSLAPAAEVSLAPAATVVMEEGSTPFAPIA
jgi:hypothetical protein